LKRSGEFCEEGFLFFVFPTFLLPEGAKNQVVKVVSGTESLVFQRLQANGWGAKQIVSLGWSVWMMIDLQINPSRKQIGMRTRRCAGDFCLEGRDFILW